MTQQQNRPNQYHPLLVSLHWLLALMLLSMLGMGTFVLTSIPNSDPEKLFALKGHMTGGMLVLVLMLARLGTRFFSATPAPAATHNALLDMLGKLTHFLLYLLVFAMAFSGMALSAQAGLPAIVFGGEGVLPASFNEFKPRLAHGFIAKALIALIALHVSAAIYHHFVKKDGLLSRMWFAKKSA